MYTYIISWCECELRINYVNLISCVRRLEALFTLTQEELGICDNGGAKDSLVSHDYKYTCHQPINQPFPSRVKVRAIPNELQVLFSRILLLNQSSVGVEGLINSFGWTNNEVN